MGIVLYLRPMGCMEMQPQIVDQSEERGVDTRTVMDVWNYARLHNLQFNHRFRGCLHKSPASLHPSVQAQAVSHPRVQVCQLIHHHNLASLRPSVQTQAVSRARTQVRQQTHHHNLVNLHL